MARRVRPDLLALLRTGVLLVPASAWANDEISFRELGGLTSGRTATAGDA